MTQDNSNSNNSKPANVVVSQEGYTAKRGYQGAKKPATNGHQPMQQQAQPSNPPKKK